MFLSRRSFIGGITSATGLSLAPVSAFAAREEEGDGYGMIQISASGMTVSMYKLTLIKGRSNDFQSGFERMAPHSSGDPFSVLASPLREGPEAQVAAETIAIVSQLIRKLQTDYQIPSERVAVIASSGVAAYSASLIALMQDDLRASTGHTIEVISPRDEGRLTFNWIVPDARRNKVLQFDIGSGNLKGGYYDRRGPKGHFFDLSAPYGTKSMAGAVKKRWMDTRTDTFSRRSAEYYADTVAPLMARQIEAAPDTMKRPFLCLTGGIVWATAVILKPQALASKQLRIPFEPDYFARIMKLVENGTPYGAGLPADLQGADRAYIEKSLHAVRNTFNPHQMAAGAAIGDGLSNQLNFDQRDKLYFATFANNTWSSQYLLEHFS